MKIKSDYGSKERLLELMQKVNNLDATVLLHTKSTTIINEQVLPIEGKNSIIDKFITFAAETLNITKDLLPKITISYDGTEAQTNKSFGGYTPYYKTIRIVAANRNLADVLRTLGHELTHHKQNLDNRLKEDSGDTGSEIENEANSKAGIMLRDFGRANPIIFE
jgi:hypothetical protein